MCDEQANVGCWGTTKHSKTGLLGKEIPGTMQGIDRSDRHFRAIHEKARVSRRVLVESPVTTMYRTNRASGVLVLGWLGAGERVCEEMPRIQEAIEGERASASCCFSLPLQGLEEFKVLPLDVLMVSNKEGKASSDKI